MSDTLPWPSRSDLQQWALDLNERVRAGELTVQELVDQLQDNRRVSRDLGWLADWLLLLAREHDAKLPALATAWSTSGRSTLVRGPDAKLKRLTDRYGDAGAVLDAFLTLPTPEKPEPAGGAEEGSP